MEIKTIALSDTDPDPDQLRREMGDLDGLVDSNRDRGQMLPIIVFQNLNRFTILDGHRQVASRKLAGKKDVLAIVHPGKPEAAALLEMQLMANCLRKDLTPIEKAHGIERLKQLKQCTNAEVAKALYMSEPMVTQSLSHLTWSPEVQAEIDSGKIPSSTAYAIARAPDEETKNALLKAVREGNLTRDDAIEAVSKRNDLKVKLYRVSCSLPGVTLTMASETHVTFQSLQVVLKQLLRESRKASKQGLDIDTFQRVLADQSRVSK
jgi:ParB/RepB/Spo0J family partition protein